MLSVVYRRWVEAYVSQCHQCECWCDERFIGGYLAISWIVSYTQSNPLHARHTHTIYHTIRSDNEMNRICVRVVVRVDHYHYYRAINHYGDYLYRITRALLPVVISVHSICVIMMIMFDYHTHHHSAIDARLLHDSHIKSLPLLPLHSWYHSYHHYLYHGFNR